MTTTLCTRCGAAVESPQLHERWHADRDELLMQIDARLTLLEAHQENLIERVYVLECAVDGGPEDVDDEEALLRQAAEAHSYGA